MAHFVQTSAIVVVVVVCVRFVRFVSFSILPRRQTEVSTLIMCRNERRNSMFRNPLQSNLRSHILRKKVDLKPHITPFAFGFLTNDGRHILMLKNKSTSVE